MLTRHSLVIRLLETNAVIEVHLTHELSDADLPRARMLTPFKTAKGVFRPTNFKKGVFFGELEIDFQRYGWARMDYKRKKFNHAKESHPATGVDEQRNGGRADQPGRRHAGVQEPGDRR